MRHSYRFILYLAVILLLSAPASICQANPGYYGLLWYDDHSDGPGDWSSADLTATAAAHFHIDTYLAFDDPLHETDYSWWCGNFDYDADGGYGNSWNQLLNLPPIMVSQTTVENISWGAIKALYRASDEGERPSRKLRGRPATYPVFTFAYRYDSEPGYDYTYVQAESLGVFVDLNSGYDGSSSGWQDYGAYGFVLSEYDDPLMLRFRFVSDGAWSDEDGLYNSVGGAFHVDNIKVYDFYGGTVYFFDDVQDGSLCLPGVPEAAGDYWHLVDDVCSSNVIPSWWCGDDADTSLIPPNLKNALYTPVISVGGQIDAPCTLYFALHAEVPTVDNDYWTEWVRFDGGVWYQIGAWWGDFAGCAGFGTAGLNGHSLNSYLPANSIQARFIFHTTDNGCGPGAAGGAGINIDDTWLTGTLYMRGEPGQAELDALAERNRQVAAAKRSLNHQRVSGLSPYKGF
jgi:hypothetical protein